MSFDPMSPDEVDAYLDLIPDGVQTVTMILTDGTFLTGRLVLSGVPERPILEAFDDSYGYRVIVPSHRIAGILEQVTTNPSGTGPPSPSLLVDPATRAGLAALPIEYAGMINPGAKWRTGERIQYGLDTIIYVDAEAISARSGGLRGIGGGFLASASVSWAPRLLSKVEGLLKHNEFPIGSHCGAPRADLTLIGYVEFFDVSNATPSAEHGPLLELEGAIWVAAAVRRSPSWARRQNEPWALCYFRRDRIGIGPANWERIGQPVRVYGDKQPQEEQTSLGLARCHLKARAAGVLIADE
jgi:hypothetical protein